MEPGNKSLDSSDPDDLVACDYENPRVKEDSKEEFPGWYERGTLEQNDRE